MQLLPHPFWRWHRIFVFAFGEAALRVVNLVEHELARDGRLCAVYLGGAALERRHHLLHHLVEEDVSELRVDEGTELEGDLRRKHRG